MSLPLYYYLAITAIYILMSWSIYLPYRAGQLHFMTVANMAISAYFAAYASIHWNWPFILVLLTGIGLGALIGYLVSFAIGDAPCFAVVIVGFTFIYITKTVIENTEALGGPLGIFSIPKILEDAKANRSLVLGLSYFFVLLVGILIHRFEHSKLGRASSAIFIDRELATSFGVNVKNMGRFLQTAASALGGLSGVLYTFIMRSLSPNHFTFHMIGICMTMLFVGGYSTLWGALLAAPILWGAPLIFPDVVQSWRIVIYGALLIIILVLKPEGVITRRMIKTLELRFSGRRKKNFVKNT